MIGAGREGQSPARLLDTDKDEANFDADLSTDEIANLSWAKVVNGVSPT